MLFSIAQARSSAASRRAALASVIIFTGFQIADPTFLTAQHRWDSGTLALAGLGPGMATGLVVGEKVTPISSAGLFVPSGKASYTSVAYQLAVPAVVAGVPDLAMVVPPTSAHPGGVLVTFGDGSVRFVSNAISLQSWRAMGRSSGARATTSANVATTMSPMPPLTAKSCGSC